MTLKVNALTHTVLKQGGLTIMALSGLMMLAAQAVTPANAAIQCRGETQYNSAVGGYIPSSYCGAEQIAAVARKHGMRVSGTQIRRNPSVRSEACQFAGSDIRIKHLCAGDLPGDYGDGAFN